MRGAVLLALVLTGASCASGPKTRDDSRGTIAHRTVEEVPVKGFEVRVTSVGKTPTLSGELLAVDAAHVWVVSSQGTTIAMHRQEVADVFVNLENAAPAVPAIWTTLGTVGAVSNGLLGVLTGPLWLLAGVPISGAMGADHVAHFEDGDLVLLQQFARFPQGLPVELWKCPVHQPMARFAGPPPPPAQAPPPGPCETREGSLTINDAAAWARFVDARCPSVDGDLNLEGLEGTTLAAPEALLMVKGSLNVRRADQLGSLEFPALRSVGGGLLVGSNAALGAVHFPALQSVGGALVLADNFVLQGVEFPALAVVGAPGGAASGGLYVENDHSLARLGLPALAKVYGGLVVRNNSVLSEVELPSLTVCDGELSVNWNALLPQCVVNAIKHKLQTGPTSYAAANNDGAPNTCLPRPR